MLIRHQLHAESTVKSAPEPATRRTRGSEPKKSMNTASSKRTGTSQLCQSNHQIAHALTWPSLMHQPWAFSHLPCVAFEMNFSSLVRGTFPANNTSNIQIK